MSDYDFRICPRCNGYGIRDNGDNCTNCGGKGTNGLRSTDGVIGSGEIIIERATGRQVTHAEFARRMVKPNNQLTDGPNPRYKPDDGPQEAAQENRQAKQIEGEPCSH